MSKYEARIWLASMWAEFKLWFLIAAIIAFPLALVLWVLMEYRGLL